MYVEKNHYKDLNIGDKSEDIQIRKRKIESTFKSVHLSLLSKIELNSLKESMYDKHWVNAMEEELNQIKKNKTSKLVP